MGILASFGEQDFRLGIRRRWLLYGTAALYLGMVAATAYHHEPWADEAQAWLLARDSSLLDLWTRVPHYEGTPPLWHTLLFILIRLGFPYSALNFFSGLLGFTGIWLLIRHAPLPLPIRLLLPFTFFLFYQYSVIARSYALLPFLLFACAFLYSRSRQTSWLFTAALCLLATVSVHGFLLSVSLAAAYSVAVASRWAGASRSDRKRYLIAGGVYCAVLILAGASAWPASDGTFVSGVNLSGRHFLMTSVSAFREAFTGESISTGVIVGLAVPFLWRGRSLLFFALSSVFLCAVGAILYSHVWHQGLLFLAWLTALWIAGKHERFPNPVLAGLIAVVLIQCYWSVRSFDYEWKHAYSGSLEAARYLRDTSIARERLHAIGFSSTSVQPYFANNLVSDFKGRKATAFWDWSVRNRANDPMRLFSSPRPDYVLVGYKADAERARWADLVKIGGYEVVSHFEGNLFWRTRILEPEGFDLYKRGRSSSTPLLSSTVHMADSGTANQLISGFYDVESNAWRWTAGSFSAVLKRPPGAEGSGATLVVRLFIPDAQIRGLGPMKLHAEIDGRPLAPYLFSDPGSHVYSRDVPLGALESEIIPVKFKFDKASPPSAADSRELGAIVAAIGLQSK